MEVVRKAGDFCLMLLGGLIIGLGLLILSVLSA